MSQQESNNQRLSSFVPLLLVVATLLTLLGFQATQLYNDRANLQQLREGQEQPLTEAQNLRKQLDGVAADTARLAEQGNANAKRVIEELAKRGITINADAKAAG